MSMNDADKKAAAIYEMIRSSSADRPFAFDSMEQLRRRDSGAEARIDRNFRVARTLCDAIVCALTAAPQPLPAELVLRLAVQASYHMIGRSNLQNWCGS